MGSAGRSLPASVGGVQLAGPILLASGTAGHGAELAAYGDLSRLGGVVVKSLAAFEWAGNPAPRLHASGPSMLNSVGLQGPGVARWLEHELPALTRAGATVVASIWGRTVAEYAAASELLAGAPREVVAVEVNLSCPNVEGKGMFAQSAEATGAVIEATAGCARPRWAKLTAMASDLPGVAAAAVDAGAEAVTLVNTLTAMALDVERRAPVLGGHGGGMSGPAIHPVAVRAVWDVHAAHPEIPIVGVGGVLRAEDALELVMAGASAVQVGTATFAEPRAAWHIQDEVERWCGAHGIDDLGQLAGAAHRTSKEEQR